MSNLAKSYVEMQKMLGQKNAGAIHKPGDNASADEIKAFREALGIPTEVDKYDLGKFEGVQIDQTTVDWAKKLGVELGIEPKALNKLVSEYFKLDTSVQGAKQAEAQRQMQEGLKSLKTEWGDGYDRNLQRANFAAEKLGGKDLVERLVKFGAHNDPLILKTFAKAAELFGEDTMREGGVSSGKTTPAELEAKISSVQARLFSMKPSDGAYLSVKQEYESLWKQKTGGR